MLPLGIPPVAQVKPAAGQAIPWLATTHSGSSDKSDKIGNAAASRSVWVEQ